MSTNFGIKDTNAFEGFSSLSFELESDINFTKSVAIYLLRSFHNGLHAWYENYYYFVYIHAQLEVTVDFIFYCY